VGLANSWPSEGPTPLWTRDLGAGHSSILVNAGRLLRSRSRAVARSERGLSRGSIPVLKDAVDPFLTPTHRSECPDSGCLTTLSNTRILPLTVPPVCLEALAAMWREKSSASSAEGAMLRFMTSMKVMTRW